MVRPAKRVTLTAGRFPISVVSMATDLKNEIGFFEIFLMMRASCPKFYKEFLPWLVRMRMMECTVSAPNAMKLLVLEKMMQFQGT